MRGSTDGFDEGDFHAVMGLVYASAIVAEEDPMVDAHVDLVKLLAIEFVSTVDAKLVLQTLVIEQLDETLLLQRQLLVIILRLKGRRIVLRLGNLHALRSLLIDDVQLIVSLAERAHFAFRIQRILIL
jgi:hypothetical protein